MRNVFMGTSKNKYLSSSSAAGFSLFELIVVVAIIGILGAIAIPQYSKFKEGAHAAEAKAGLGAIYVAERAFFTEYGAYHSSFDAIGFTPAARGVYNIGFGVPGTSASAAQGYYTTVDTTLISSKVVCTGFGSAPASSACSLIYSAPDLQASFSVGTNYFYAAATSNPANYASNDLNLSGHPILTAAITAVSASQAYAAPAAGTTDTWSIDHLKVIKHNHFGLSQSCPAIMMAYPSCGGAPVIETRDNNQCLTGWVCGGVPS